MKKNLHLNEELKNKQKLAEAGRRNCFGVPENYFEKFPEQMVRIAKAETLEQELEDSKLLQSLRYSNPFETPAGYFTGKTERLLAESKPKGILVRLIPGRTLIFRSLTVASLAAAIVTAIIMIPGNPDQPVKSQPIAESALLEGRTAKTIQYIETNITDYDLDLIASEINFETIESSDLVLPDSLTNLDGLMIDATQFDLSDLTITL